MLYLTVIFGSDIWERLYPNVNKTITYKQQPDIIPFDKNNVPIAFGIQNYTGWAHYIDESLYVPYVHYYIAEKALDPNTGKYFTNITDTVIKAVPCKRKDMFDFEPIKEFIDKMQLDNLYCIPNDGSIPLRLGGNYDIGVYQSIVIEIRSCEDEMVYSLVNMDDETQTQNRTPCRSIEEINE